MDGIYSKLTGIAQMQMDLIKDGEPAVPVSETDYYTEMDIDCGTWPSHIARAVAEYCLNLAEEFAIENEYSVVRVTEHKAYTHLDLYEPVCDENDWELSLLVSLCVPAIGGPEALAAGINYILTQFIKTHGKIILV
jgi:hypothetical protein